MEETVKVSKFKRFKEWIKVNDMAVITGIIVVIAVIIITLLSCNWDSICPMYSIEGTVMSVGYKGITVTYPGKYGEERTAKIKVDNPSEYQIGDTITIQTSGGYAPAKIQSSDDGKH